MAGQVLRALVPSGLLRADHDGRRPQGDQHLAALAVVGHDERAAAVEARRARRRRVPAYRLRPTSRATYPWRGAARPRPACPPARSGPSSSTSSRSASTSASSGSCVTSRHGPGEVARGGARSSVCTSRRVRASRADERLVEQQQRGLAGQRPGERDPLRLTAGQLGRSARVPARRCPSRSSQGSAAARRGRATQPAGARRERHVVAHAQVREEPVVLEDEADRAARRLDEDTARPRRRATCAAAGRSGRRSRGSGRRAPASRVRLPGAVRVRARRAPRRARPSNATPKRERAAGHAGASTCDGPPGAGPVGRRVTERTAAQPAVAQRTSTTTDTSSSTRLSSDGGVGVGLERVVDRDRHRLGAAREAAGEGDRRAELAQRAGPAEHRAGDQRRRDQRQR